MAPGRRVVAAPEDVTGAVTDSKLIVLSLYGELSVARAAMGAGVDGFVLKRAIATDMLDAVAAVVNGRSYISPGVRGFPPA